MFSIYVIMTNDCLFPTIIFHVMSLITIQIRMLSIFQDLFTLLNNFLQIFPKKIKLAKLWNAPILMWANLVIFIHLRSNFIDKFFSVKFTVILFAGKLFKK